MSLRTDPAISQSRNIPIAQDPSRARSESRNIRVGQVNHTIITPWGRPQKLAPFRRLHHSDACTIQTLAQTISLLRIRIQNQSEKSFDELSSALDLHAGVAATIGLTVGPVNRSQFLAILGNSFQVHAETGCTRLGVGLLTYESPPQCLLAPKIIFRTI